MYADIVEIVAPNQASPGELVNVEVKVKNLSDYGFYIAVSAVVDGSQIPITPDYAGVDPGATSSFYGSLTMPSSRVTITAYSWFWTGSEWYRDDQMTKDIALATLTPQVSEFKIADCSKV